MPRLPSRRSGVLASNAVPGETWERLQLGRDLAVGADWVAGMGRYGRLKGSSNISLPPAEP